MISALWIGVSAPFHGLRLMLTRPALWLIALLPFLVGLAWSLLSMAEYISDQTSGGLIGFAAAIIAAGFAALVILMQVVIAALSPLLDYLAERSELVLGIPESDARLLDDLLSGRFFPRAARALLEGIKLLLFKLLISALAGLISFIDLYGPPVAITMVGLVLALDFIDYPLARREMTLGEKITWLQQNALSAISFSLTCYLLIMTPGVAGIAFVPCVIGGTWMAWRLGLPGSAHQSGQGDPRIEPVA